MSVSNTRVFGLESGTFRAIHRPEAPGFWAFWRLAWVRAKGGCRLRELNRRGGGNGLGSGRLEGGVPRWCSGRCPGGQAEMGEDLGNHGGMFDGGDDRQGAAAVGTLFNIDSEHPDAAGPS